MIVMAEGDLSLFHKDHKGDPEMVGPGNRGPGNRLALPHKWCFLKIGDPENGGFIIVNDYSNG